MKQLLIATLAFTVSGCMMGATQDSVVKSNGSVVSKSHYDSNGFASHSSSEVEMAPNCMQCKNDNPARPELCNHLCYPMGGYAGGGMMGPTPAQASLMMTPGAFVPTTPPVPPPAPTATSAPAPTASSQFVTKQEYHGDMKLMSKALDCLNKKQKGITDPKCTGK